MMKNSDNFYAEQIIKTIGAEVMGAGSWSNGIKAVKQFLCDIGIDATQLRMVDGSGLSRYNLLSPQLVVNLLKYMYSETFLTSLPMAGVDGTLKNRMKGTPLEGNLKAKTGTMSGVSALSGYITTESGDVIAFSIMINNYAKSSKPIKIIEDEIAEIIYAAREVNK
jgi:D-alanyl-D-alanine carboxypeptidase (penicillin-binding protein 4)